MAPKMSRVLHAAALGAALQRVLGGLPGGMVIGGQGAAQSSECGACLPYMHGLGAEDRGQQRLLGRKEVKEMEGHPRVGQSPALAEETGSEWNTASGRSVKQ